MPTLLATWPHHTPVNSRRPERATEPISPPVPAKMTSRSGNTNSVCAEPGFNRTEVAVISALPDTGDVRTASAKNLPLGIDTSDGRIEPTEDVRLTMTS